MQIEKFVRLQPAIDNKVTADAFKSSQKGTAFQM